MPEDTEGLNGEKEPATSVDLFEKARLESPLGEEKGKEPPKVDAKDGTDGDPAVKSSDSDLVGIFDDLEKDIDNLTPAQLKERAGLFKKKADTFFTQKHQKLSEKEKALEEKQMTEDFKSNYGHLYTWYDGLRTNPKAGLKNLAKELGVKPEDIIDAVRAQPEQQPLRPDQLETREDYVRYIQQFKSESDLKIAELEERQLSAEESKVRMDKINYGVDRVQDAINNLPGFVDKEGQFTEDAKKALKAVVAGGKFIGEEGIRNAWASVRVGSYDSKLKELETKLKESEDKYQELQRNLKGAQPPLNGQKGGKTEFSVNASSSDFWEKVRKQSLTT